LYTNKSYCCVSKSSQYSLVTNIQFYSQARLRHEQIWMFNTKHTPKWMILKCVYQCKYYDLNLIAIDLYSNIYILMIFGIKNSRSTAPLNVLKIAHVWSSQWPLKVSMFFVKITWDSLRGSPDWRQHVIFAAFPPFWPIFGSIFIFCSTFSDVFETFDFFQNLHFGGQYFLTRARLFESRSFFWLTNFFENFFTCENFFSISWIFFRLASIFLLSRHFLTCKFPAVQILDPPFESREEF
jgi:hypothetical protein